VGRHPSDSIRQCRCGYLSRWMSKRTQGNVTSTSLGSPKPGLLSNHHHSQLTTHPESIQILYNPAPSPLYLGLKPEGLLYQLFISVATRRIPEGFVFCWLSAAVDPKIQLPELPGASKRKKASASQVSHIAATVCLPK
jgi:hypothetical protein